MRLTGWNIAALVVLMWFITPLLLGGSTGGVYGGSTYSTDAGGAPDPNQTQPNCISTHVFDQRAWGNWQTIRYDVWVNGCRDSNGKLQLSSPPACSASSFLGPGSATCTASRNGSRLKIDVRLTYPLYLGLIAGYPTSPVFYVDPGGGYSTY